MAGRDTNFGVAIGIDCNPKRTGRVITGPPFRHIPIDLMVLCPVWRDYTMEIRQQME